MDAFRAITVIISMGRFELKFRWGAEAVEAIETTKVALACKVAKYLEKMSE